MFPSFIFSPSFLFILIVFCLSLSYKHLSKLFNVFVVVVVDLAKYCFEILLCRDYYEN